MIRVPIIVSCDHPQCGRSTNATARLNGGGLGLGAFFDHVKFPDRPDGTPSEWQVNGVNLGACPDHAPKEHL